MQQVASIVIVGGIGISLPKIFPALGQEKDGLFLVKSFDAGVMLSRGLIHILPDAFNVGVNPN